MAPAAVTQDVAMDTGDQLSKPPPGIVLPPKEIRTVIEKTAGYIVRNGPAFEDRIRQNNANNPKFSFLSPNDAYSAYFHWRLGEIRAGREVDTETGKMRAAATTQEPEKPKGPPEPPEFHFSARMPNISAQDLEVVRLTALFVAKNGRSFQTSLMQRESSNYQFDFLRPQHSLHQFFSRMVDQYTELLTGDSVDGGKPQKERIAQLELNVKNRFHMLERARQRAEWVKFQEQQKQKREEEQEAEKRAFQEIDWHDFVVVETVTFNEADEASELPPPTSLSDLQSASLEQKAMMSLHPSALRIEEAAPDDDIYTQPTAPAVQMPPPQAAYMPQPTAPVSAEYSMPMRSAQEDEEEQRIRERQEARERAQQAQAAAKGVTGPMRIRSDYVPRAQAKRQNVAMALCPNCKQQIPFDELEQHMRIELLDPRWKEQKAKADSRYATTNLSTSDVANNLKRLASQRTDVFDGVTGQPISEEEAARRKRAATSYDGTIESKDAVRMQQMQSMNIEEQIRQIQGKYKQGS